MGIGRRGSRETRRHHQSLRVRVDASLIGWGRGVVRLSVGEERMVNSLFHQAERVGSRLTFKTICVSSIWSAATIRGPRCCARCSSCSASCWGFGRARARPVAIEVMAARCVSVTIGLGLEMTVHGGDLWSGKVAGIAVSGWNWNLAWPAGRGATGVSYQLIGSMRRERRLPSPPELRVHRIRSPGSAIHDAVDLLRTDAQMDCKRPDHTRSKTSSNSTP
jgi:hypothetical protein